MDVPCETIIVTDVEGRYFDLVTAMREARLVKTLNETITNVRRDMQLISLGDAIDRGPDSREVLESLRTVHRSSAFLGLTGNHEMMARWSLQTRNPDRVLHWMQHGGLMTLASFCLAKNFVKSDSHIFPVDTKGDRRIEDTWHTLVSRPSLRVDCDFRAAFICAEQELLRGRYASIFDQGRIVHALGSALLVHGGIDEWLAKEISVNGVDAVNEAFRVLRDERNFASLNENERIGAALWRRSKHNSDNRPLTKKTAKILQTCGFDFVIHGHERADSYQTCEDCHGIRVLNANMNVHDLGANFVRVQVNGDVWVWSEYTGEEKQVGTLRTPPRSIG